MPFSLSLKSLIRLQKRQLLAGKTKRDLIGPLIMLVYMWGLEIVVFFVAKEEAADLDIPSLVLLIACAGLLIFDFIYKLIFVRDHTVMDAFLKSRPILQAQWNRFLTLSQCWSVSNLTMPVMVLPVCLLYLPFFRGLALWIGLYVASVLGGCLVMLLKRRGTYASEKVVSTAAVRTVNSGRSGHAIFGLQSRSLLRSKRLKGSILYFSIFSFLETILYLIAGDTRFGNLWLFFFITFPAITLPQYGFGIEATYFGGLWTRPVVPLVQAIHLPARLLCPFRRGIRLPDAADGRLQRHPLRPFRQGLLQYSGGQRNLQGQFFCGDHASSGPGPGYPGPSSRLALLPHPIRPWPPRHPLPSALF